MSAIQSVTATINGQQYTLNYNSSTGAYEASVTAPTKTSFNVNNGHYYPVTIKATDIAGNVETIDDSDAVFGESLKLRVKESAKPTITFITPTNGAGLTNNKPTFKLKVLDEGSGIDLSTFTLKVDSTTINIANCTKTTITNGYEITYTSTTALTDGSHTITANVSDNDGNAASAASITVKVDTAPPTLSITTPNDNSYTNIANCSVIGVTNDALSSPVMVSITLNGVDVGAVSVGSDGSFTKAITLAEGQNTIVTTATDALGKSASVTRTVILDTSAPKFTSVTIAPNPVNAGVTYTISVKLESN